MKSRCKLDDSLDVLAVHGVGGATGTLLAAVFASTALGGVGFADGVTMGSQFGVQVIGVIATIIWAAVASLLIVKLCQAVCGLRSSEEEIIEGLDFTSHGEKGYHF